MTNIPVRQTMSVDESWSEAGWWAAARWSTGKPLLGVHTDP